MGGKGYTAPSDKLNIVGIGVGGKGTSNLEALESQNIVALCDVDYARAEESFKRFPKAKKYKDYRVMYDEMMKDIDAVVVSTPDHSHALPGLIALRNDKHVYIEKPLAHNIREVRLLTEAAAARPKVATQMGNQGASGEGTRRIQEMLAADMIGEVHTIHAWTNRPIWPQGGKVPEGTMPVPATLDWNLWLGAAEERPYHEAYHPFSWRGYWDFGTGALGDMACHIIDSSFYALDLGYPSSAQASVGQVYSQNWNPDYHPETAPPSSTIHLEFPARGKGRPAVSMHWYDGGILPQRPEELLPDEMMGEWGGGVILEGTKGKLMHDVYGNNPRLIPTTRMEEKMPEPTMPRVEVSHQMDWANAAKEGRQPSSHLGKAGPLTETVLMGNLAIRGYDQRFPKAGGKKDEYNVPGRTTLIWDGPNMRVTNVEEMNHFVTKEYREGFEVKG